MPNDDNNSVISKLRIIKKVNNKKEEESFPIGVYSENVIISDSIQGSNGESPLNYKFSLTQLYNYLKNFFNNGAFSWYGSVLPNNNVGQIIDFYQIEEIPE